MQIKVDDSLCIGCGLCVDACAQVFSMTADGKAAVNLPLHTGDSDMEEVAGLCPVDAIEVDE